MFFNTAERHKTTPLLFGLNMSKLNLGFHLHPTTLFLKNFLRIGASIHKKLLCSWFSVSFRVFFLHYSSALNAKKICHMVQLEKFYTSETSLSILAIMLLKFFTFATEDVCKLLHKTWRREKMSHSVPRT